MRFMAAQKYKGRREAIRYRRPARDDLIGPEPEMHPRAGAGLLRERELVSFSPALGRCSLSWRIDMAGKLASSLVLIAAMTLPSVAEFQCAPSGVAVALPEGDAFFDQEVSAWSRATRSRYLEGNGRCADVSVPGYEGFPTKRCSYASVDAGAGAFQPLAADVVLLDPSARQLAAWSINACRKNGATDAGMSKCLRALRSHIRGQNGAQFPVAGSVVESFCNSSGAYPDGCDPLGKADRGRQPRNTWFRDGVSVDYKPAQRVSWDGTAYSKQAFDAVFDVTTSDRNLKSTKNFARIAGAARDQWTEWRARHADATIPENSDGPVAGHGWRKISAAVHKDACRSASNLLFNAVVYNQRRSWIRP